MSSRKGGSRKRSWVWSYFEEAEAEVGRKGRYLIEINNNTCGHIVYTDSGTSNFITHLSSVHNIINEAKQSNNLVDSNIRYTVLIKLKN